MTSPDLLNQLEILSQVGAAGDLSDAHLLRRLLAGPEATSRVALAALVERHGPMVLRACRHALGDSHDAQDAFQATFLVLTRKSGSFREIDSVAGWLHGVAIRVARRAKADAARRSIHERRGAAKRKMVSEDRVAGPDSWTEIHEEISRLPERYREPVVLCYLEGLSTEAAALRIGCPRGTVLSRLSRARGRLRERLMRRGLAPPDLPMLTPIPLSAAAIRSAIQVGLRPALASAGATSLTRKVVILMSLHQGMRGVFPLLACGITAVSIAVAGVRGAQGLPRIMEPAAAIPQDSPPPVSKKATRVTRQAHSLAFAPDGKTVAAQCADGSVVILDATTKDRHVVLQGAGDAVRAVAYSPDGQTLAGACDGNRVMFWDQATGELRRTIPAFGDPSLRASSSFSFSPGGSGLALIGRRQGVDPSGNDTLFEVRLVDVPSGQPIWSHMGRGEGSSAVAFSPDGLTLASSGKTSVRLWDARTGEPGRVLKAERGSGHQQRLAFSPDGTELAGGGYFMTDRRLIGQVTIWDTRTGEVLRTLDAPGRTSSVAFSPDGKTVAAGGDGPVREYKTGDGGEGHMLVSETRLWDVATGERLWSSEGELASVTSICFAPDGKALVRCDGETVALIDAKTGMILRILMRTPGRL